jgi:hypothetical protein
MDAFGEGWAVLAAAGGPHVDPHASDDSAGRAVWHHDYARVADDMHRLDAFFIDVLDGRLRGRDSTQTVAMSFYGPVQGPWYTVGYLMVQTIELARGRPALLARLCDPVQLVLTYQDIAVARDHAGGRLPLWSDSLIQRLRRGR